MKSTGKEGSSQRFLAILNGARIATVDPIMPMMLKFHLLTENNLERMIRFNLKRGDRILSKGGLSYRQKLTLVDSFDILSRELIECLQRLNALRNKCAHQVDRPIIRTDIEDIGRPLGGVYFEIARSASSTLYSSALELFGEIYMLFKHLGWRDSAQGENEREEVVDFLADSTETSNERPYI